MNLARLYNAVYTRLTGDATLAGLATGGVRSVMGPRSGIAAEDAKPYVVIVVSGTTANNGLDSDGFEANVDIHVVSDTLRGMDVPLQIIDRVYGDATMQASKVPTFGLHRHLLVLTTSSYTAGIVEFVDSETAHDEERLHFIVGFRVFYARQKP